MADIILNTCPDRIPYGMVEIVFRPQSQGTRSPGREDAIIRTGKRLNSSGGTSFTVQGLYKN
jgi:hypothetical protein